MNQLTEYMKFTRTTAKYPQQFALPYLALGLAGESGEVAEKIKKSLRDDNGVVTPERKEALVKELGDVIWYWTRILDELGIDPNDVINSNIAKLSDRKERGVISGSGDNR